MTIEEFKELGYFVDTFAPTYAYGRWDFDNERVIIEEYDSDINADIEYRIIDKDHNIIEGEFWDIEDVIDYIKNM